MCIRDRGVGNEQDYNTEYGADTIGPESKQYEDDSKIPAEPKNTKKDTVNKEAIKNNDNTKPIGAPAQETKKKKNILQRIFTKKNN